VVLNEAAATDKRVVEEATTKRAAEERLTEEAATKATAAEEVADKTTDEAAGVAGGSLAPGQAPSVAGAKRVTAPSGTTPPAKRLYMGVWKPRFVQLSLLSLFFEAGLHSLITLVAQVLSLWRGHRDRHNCFYHRHHYRRCGCRGDSRAGS
jgi:hypothetical protein